METMEEKSIFTDQNSKDQNAITASLSKRFSPLENLSLKGIFECSLQVLIINKR